MTLSEWTFGTNIDQATRTTDDPPDTSETDPHIDLDPNGAGTAMWFYPTNNSIGGKSTLGYNSGQVTFWHKMSSAVNPDGAYFFFRLLDTMTPGNTGLGTDGYRVLFTTGGADTSEVRRIVAGVDTLIGAFTTTVSTWFNYRVQWWEAGANMLIKVDRRADGADPFTNLGLFIDTVNTHKSSTNKMAFRLTNGLGGAQHEFFEGIRISSQVV